jgi:hypothetical protein
MENIASFQQNENSNHQAGARSKSAPRHHRRTYSRQAQDWQFPGRTQRARDNECAVWNAWAYIEASGSHPTEASIARLTHRGRHFVRVILRRITAAGLMTKAEPVYRSNRLQYLPRVLNWDRLRKDPREPVRTSTVEPVRVKSLRSKSLETFETHAENSLPSTSNPTPTAPSTPSPAPYRRADLAKPTIACTVLNALADRFGAEKDRGGWPLLFLCWLTASWKKDPQGNRPVWHPAAYAVAAGHDFLCKYRFADSMLQRFDPEEQLPGVLFDGERWIQGPRPKAKRPPSQAFLTKAELRTQITTRSLDRVFGQFQTTGERKRAITEAAAWEVFGVIGEVMTSEPFSELTGNSKRLNSWGKEEGTDISGEVIDLVGFGGGSDGASYSFPPPVSAPEPGWTYERIADHLQMLWEKFDTRIKKSRSPVIARKLNKYSGLIGLLNGKNGRDLNDPRNLTPVQLNERLADLQLRMAADLRVKLGAKRASKIMNSLPQLTFMPTTQARNVRCN